MSLKDKAKRFAAAHAPLEKSVYWFYRLKNQKTAEAEIEKRKKASLFDVATLSAEMEYAPEERVIDNNLYGYAKALKNYASIQHDLGAYMEHGLFLGGIVHEDQKHWHFDKIITMSQERIDVLNDQLPEKNAIAIGPYIHYAQPLLSKVEFKKLKQKLGRTLLFFPFHSMKGVEVGFEENALIEEIKLRAINFDTVLVSMYYIDSQNPQRLKPYKDAGFKIVTAGHRFDPNFVRRQRTHIELADMTMSNGMGTQTGFCVYLNKPHYIFNQNVAQKMEAAEAQRHTSQTQDMVKQKVAQTRELFAELFANYAEEISAEQAQITGEYWGFGQIKTPAQLQAIFKK